MIKFFVDECINIDIILALRQKGVDVLTVKDAGLTGSDDEIVYNFAKDNHRVLLTFDRGFGDIFRFNISKSAGVIIILVNQMAYFEIADILFAFFLEIGKGNIRGKLVIIGKSKIRIRER